MKAAKIYMALTIFLVMCSLSYAATIDVEHILFNEKSKQLIIIIHKNF